MVLLDVNVLVTAMREDAPRHPEINAYVGRLRVLCSERAPIDTSPVRAMLGRC